MGKRAFARMDREFVNEEAIRGTFLKTFRMRTGGWSPVASPALIPAPINAGEGERAPGAPTKVDAVWMNSAWAEGARHADEGGDNPS